MGPETAAILEKRRIIVLYGVVPKLIELCELIGDGGLKHLLEGMALPKNLSDLYVLLFSRCTRDDLQNIRHASTALKVLTVT